MTMLPKSLKNMMDDVIEIDSYQSKMGSDQDIVTLSFSLRTKEAADDFNSFIEKGYGFVLDADTTAGEQSDGTYKVFIEIERDNTVHDNIMELIDGATKISGIDKFRFRYYKNFRSQELNAENIKNIVPDNPDEYGLNKDNVQMENYKNFFNRSYVESVDMLDDIVSIKKAYADPLFFRFFDVGPKEKILENLKEKINVNDYPEILFLTKYIGDYNITKYGDKLVMENSGTALVLKRTV